MTAFRKVSVKERLPVGEVFCINKDGYQSSGCLEVDTSSNRVHCQGDNEEMLNVEYWLEEVELPNDDEISNQADNKVLIQASLAFIEGVEYVMDKLK